MNLLTAEDRDKFYEYIEKWIDILGLQRWQIMRSNKSTKSMAEVRFDGDEANKMASVLLGSDWKSTPPTEVNLEKVAVHELCHILLYDFKQACIEHPHNETLHMNKEHEIVSTLERVLMRR